MLDIAGDSAARPLIRTGTACAHPPTSAIALACVAALLVLRRWEKVLILAPRAWVTPADPGQDICPRRRFRG